MIVSVNSFDEFFGKKIWYNVIFHFTIGTTFFKIIYSHNSPSNFIIINFL